MDEREEDALYPLWIDWDNRIVSFQDIDGFEEILFANNDDKLRFAIARGNEGFGIQ